MIVKELIEANRSIRKPVIVILSEKDSVEMNQKIKENVGEFANTRIICRTGSIYKKQDLSMCSIENAKSVIILEGDFNTIKSLLVVTDTKFYTKKTGHVTVLMRDKENIDVASEFDHYFALGSHIDFLVNSHSHIAKILELQNKLKNIQVNVVQNETYKRNNLETFIEPSCRRVILFANDGLSNSEKDSQTLLTLLHLRAIEETRGISLDVISEIADVKNADIIDLAKVDDFIISDLMANRMVAQISENRHLASVFEDLLDNGGSEIYLKPMEDYVELEVDVDFYAVTAAAISHNKIAIGYQVSKQAHETLLKINPDKTKVLKFKKGDMVIVIAED